MTKRMNRNYLLQKQSELSNLSQRQGRKIKNKPPIHMDHSR